MRSAKSASAGSGTAVARYRAGAPANSASANPDLPDRAPPRTRVRRGRFDATPSDGVAGTDSRLRGAHLAHLGGADERVPAQAEPGVGGVRETLTHSVVDDPPEQ